MDGCRFEQSQPRPLLSAWLLKAKRLGISEREAILTWLKAPVVQQCENERKDYSAIEDRAELRRIASEDRQLPRAFREVIKSDSFWEEARLTRFEINILRDVFISLDSGTNINYREALKLIREFGKGS